MISPEICNESCNALDDSSTKICIQKKARDINVKVFNILNEKKMEQKHW